MRILHCFADTGTEADTLSTYGEVIRVGIDATPNSSSDAIKADANHLPFSDSAQFDLGVFHPPCTKWSMMPNADVNGDAPNLIPLSRKIAAKHCDHWIIENRPNAPLNDPVYLTGHMFNIAIEYERAFETSFHVDQPPKQSKLAETSTFFYTERPKKWWMAVKGCSAEYTHQHIAKNTIPSAYLDYLMQWYSKASDKADRPDYSEYDKEMDTKRAKNANGSLEDYV